MNGGARKIVVGVTGGIAAFKVPSLVRLLRKSGCEVKTVLTAAAKPLVGAEALRVLSGSPVYTDDKPAPTSASYDIDHIRLSEWADALLICPATANTIAKMAAGVADNLLTTLALSVPEEKIVVAPAMNCVMWANKATQANVNTLSSRGVTVLPVGEGLLACGVRGPGRMLGIEEIAKRVIGLIDSVRAVDNNGINNNSIDTNGTNADDGINTVDTVNNDNSVNTVNNIVPINTINTDNAAAAPTLKGKNVLISSGPTEEPIDPVRVVTNKSSGKMGAALAAAALSMGARVTVVSGPAAAPLPDGAEVVRVNTAAEMFAAMSERFPSADVCVMAAAVSDYRPANPSACKLRRSESGGGNIVIELAPNPDILAALGAVKAPGQFLVGFSLESGDDVDRAEAKMRKKNCDLMVFNRADAALGGDGTSITLLSAVGGREPFPAMPKTAAARLILERAAGWKSPRSQ